jgi:hypothetical protein
MEVPTLTLSKRQAKEADRVGGIELMIPWPPALGPEPIDLLDDEERDATPREKAMAEAMIRASCAAHGLVPVRTQVARVRRPDHQGMQWRGEVRTHLAVIIIGARWVHAKGQPESKAMFVTTLPGGAR